MTPGFIEYPPKHLEKASTQTVKPEEYLRRIAEALQLPGKERNHAVARVVIAGLRDRGRFYHLRGEPSFRTAMYFDTSTKTLDRIKSDRFAQTVSDLFQLNRASSLWSFVEAAIENESIGPSSTGVEPAAFWACQAGVIYLSNGPGAMVRITATRVELVDNGSDGILFPRGSTLAPWQITEPLDPFDHCELFRGVNTTAGHGRLLSKLWSMTLPTDVRNKPPLCLSGTVGSGKTRFAIGLCELYGLPTEGRVLKVEENAERDFWPIMDAGGLVVLDNADTRAKWLPDALAAAATGGTQAKRRLYTDNDLVALRPRAWLAITSARPDTFAGDAGLADRLLVVRMDRRKGDTKDAELSEQIQANRNAGLSWICNKLSTALGDSTEPPGALNRRHPDFARIAFRLGRAIGLEAEAIAALGAAEEDKSLFCLENDTVGLAVLNHIRCQGRFSGTAKELLEAMKEGGQLDCDTTLSTKGIGRRLDSIWPHLEAVTDCQREKNRSGVTEYRFHSRNPTSAKAANETL